VNLADNLEKIQQRIRAACDHSGREANSVTLLAVTKSHPPEVVQAAAKLGLIFFGENKVQEAKAKIPLCPGNLRWHMIGHLQSNKCRDAVELFKMIQSVDSLSLAQEINKRAELAARTMPVLIEVNVKELNALTRIEIHGLMTVPPWSPEAEKTRPHFRRLREVKAQCEQILGAPLPDLSMGMSGDFEIAIEEGATMVRIGTELCGPRTKARPRAEAD
jgi:hypothetical protein